MSNKDGFRLNRLELYNWGLYHHDVASIDPASESALLIGANASGKSTLVDALLTLFLSRPKYNLAGDANKKNDRDIYSYVRGAFLERTNENGNIETVYLREKGEFSFIGASFVTSQATAKKISIIQFFWFDVLEALSPKRLFIISEAECIELLRDLEIESITDEKLLKKRLRTRGILPESDTKNESRTGLYTDKFSVYSNKLAELFGFMSKDKALHLFNQAVSLKNVGDLTMFIRSEMLNEFSVEKEISNLQETFDAAKRISDKIIDAENKLNVLKPIDETGAKYLELNSELNSLEFSKNAAPLYFSSLKCCLLKEEIAIIEFKLANLVEKMNRHFSEGGTLKTEKLFLEEINENIIVQETKLGRQIIENEYNTAVDQLNATLDRKRVFRENITKLKLDFPNTVNEFNELKKAFVTMQSQVENDLSSLGRKSDEINQSIGPVKIQERELIENISALSSQADTLLDNRFLVARQEISKRTGVPVSELPFVSELVQVKKEAHDWRFSIEKLLRPYALNILVKDKYYTKSFIQEINDFTFDDTKVKFTKVEQSPQSLKIPSNKNSLYHKLEFKPEADTVFLASIKKHLSTEYDYLCGTKEEIFESNRGMTTRGLTKRNRYSHEKDDRKNSNKESYLILGWDNKDKIGLLKKELTELENKLRAFDSTLSDIKSQSSDMFTRSRALESLLEIKDFEDINEMPHKTRIEELELKKSNLSKDESLSQLRDEQRISRRKIEVLEFALQRSIRYEERLRAMKKDLLTQHSTSNLILEAGKEFDIMQALEGGIYFKCDQIDNSQDCDRVLGDVQNEIAQRTKQVNAEIKLLQKPIKSAISDFYHKFETEARRRDLGDDIEQLGEYIEWNREIKTENLPQYKIDFNKKIKEQNDDRMIDLRRELLNEKTRIEDRISQINETLKLRHYEKDRTYIQVLFREVHEKDIDDFKRELLSCFYPTGPQTDEERDRETRAVFNNIQALLEKLKLLNDPDKGRWARKVLDVRNWFVFSASERSIHDPSIEVKAHSGTAGHSGGETSKITYTILACAISYQFGLETNVDKPNCLRFIAIDEMFNNLGEKWSHYVLEMFTDLGLQLLIVSPDSLEKVAICDQYIKNVHWTHKISDDDKDESRVFNITKHELMEKVNAVKESRYSTRGV